MRWSQEAEQALKKVPFFVRKKVRTRVEAETAGAGKKTVSLADVKRTRERFMADMGKEVKGYQVSTCFGGAGCPNRVLQTDRLLEKIERIFEKADILAFLKNKVGTDLKFHHEFRVALAECPNACSQPQIKDIGIIGAAVPQVTDEPCSACRACVDDCPDDCAALPAEADRPTIDVNACMHCGKCIAACPTGTIAEDRRGFRVLLGGKLGRHPQLARELPGIFDESDVLAIVDYCISFYKRHSEKGQRFANLLQPADFEKLSAEFEKERKKPWKSKI
ncbi:MAG: 4Fe-4S dicluster domain-containing protein [Deltaproteobacteria bacterium]|jgi:anaerobic sulfite reductase subunit C|nr:4Fe-4S dicluster domain-containing protein [Deltaproteobacteria bacterium]